jgi:CheY-like chemotaxis protein
MSQPSKRSKSGQNKAVLVYIVDDEPLLLDLAEATLETLYKVKKFTDPVEAWASFEKESSKPALIISDYAMGKLNGVELMTRCKTACPALKTMLLSGTAGAEIVLNATIKIDRFLGKPYQPSVLLEAVKQVLAAG